MDNNKLEELEPLKDYELFLIEWIESHPDEFQKMIDTFMDATNAIAEAISVVAKKAADAISILADALAQCDLSELVIEDEEDEENKTYLEDEDYDN